MAGSRFFEVKTVQVMDGAELSACVNKPCIVAEDECYNCEWSTELEVGQALNEYVKAWWACKCRCRASLGWVAADGFVFNMSVGYDLEGIKSAKVDNYIEFHEGREQHGRVGRVPRLGARQPRPLRARRRRVRELREPATSPPRSPSPRSTAALRQRSSASPPTLSARRASTPTSSATPRCFGYDYARARLNELGFDYIAFDDKHFVEDLQGGTPS